MAFSSMLASVVLGLLVLLVAEAAAGESDTKLHGNLDYFAPDDTDAPGREKEMLKEFWKEKAMGAFKDHTESAAGVQMRETRYKTWDVAVDTGDRDYAGTDARVYIRIVGRGGTTADVQLDNSHKDDFERNARDWFTVTLEDVGEPLQLTVWHDNTGSGAGWYLDDIFLDDETTVYRFICGTWLAAETGYATWRTLDVHNIYDD